MSSLRKVRINYCNAKLNEKPSFGPVLMTEDNNPIALIGTMSGALIRIPLIFGRTKDYRSEYTMTRISSENTINLKELFLDQETASSVIGLCTIDDEAIMVSLLDGKIYEIHKQKLRLIAEFESTLSASPTIMKNKDSDSIIVPTTDGSISIIDMQGNVLAVQKLDSICTSRPLYVPEKNIILAGCKHGHVYCLSESKGTISELWRFQAKKDITTDIIACDLMNDGRTFFILGSADKNIYCMTEEGLVAWTFPTDGKIISGAYIDDINNDGIKEIVFGSCDDKVYVVSAYGNELWNYETDFWVAATPAVIDVDNDSYKEVFVGSYDNSLYCFSPEADFVPGFFSGASGIVQQSASYEHAETNSGYFARKLFQEQLDGMIIGIHAHEKSKILAAVTNKGEFRSFQFENE